MCVCVCVHAFMCGVCACMCGCAYAHVCTFLRVCVCVFVWRLTPQGETQGRLVISDRQTAVGLQQEPAARLIPLPGWISQPTASLGQLALTGSCWRKMVIHSISGTLYDT